MIWRIGRLFRKLFARLYMLPVACWFRVFTACLSAGMWSRRICRLAFLWEKNKASELPLLAETNAEVRRQSAQIRRRQTDAERASAQARILASRARLPRGPNLSPTSVVENVLALERLVEELKEGAEELAKRLDDLTKRSASLLD